MPNPLSLLEQRHSVASRQLGEPAPDEATLHALFAAAIRVPDHGKLVPFRLICLQGEDKRVWGERMAELAARKNPEISPAKLEKERGRYSYAPLVVAVIACLRTRGKVPEIEQKLSAGCVAHNLLLGAYALGFGAQWLTGWAAYDEDAARMLGLEENEHVIGFVHIGTAQGDMPDHDRPCLDDVLSSWRA
ncbi:MAG: nitroreductase [Rhodanobacter sp.]